MRGMPWRRGKAAGAVAFAALDGCRSCRVPRRQVPMKTLRQRRRLMGEAVAAALATSRDAKRGPTGKALGRSMGVVTPLPVVMTAALAAFRGAR
jgi:hypothetical protein